VEFLLRNEVPSPVSAGNAVAGVAGLWVGWAAQHTHPGGWAAQHTHPGTSLFKMAEDVPTPVSLVLTGSPQISNYFLILP